MTSTMRESEHADILTVVQSILKDDRSLELRPRDIALLVLIRHRIDTKKDSSFSIVESEIRSLSDNLDDMEVRDPYSSEKRATESLNRLLRANCLARTDINKLIQSVDIEYHTTTLGESIAVWHIEESRFSGEPLTAILRAFNSHLAVIVSEAETIDNADLWQKNIIDQIQYVLKEMLININRHQRDLDRQHDSIRAFIPTLLTEDSELSIDLCEKELSQVIKTIDDLQEVTLASVSTALSLLDKIETIGITSSYSGTEVTCRDIERRLNSVVQWTNQKATDWVKHHNLVHDFLRTIIRVDRQRRLTNALKHSIAAEPIWTMVVAEEVPLTRIREDLYQERIVKQAPRLAKNDKERDVEEITPDELPDKLNEFLLEAIGLGEARLSGICRQAVKDGAEARRLIPYLPWFIGQLVSTGKVDDKSRSFEEVSGDVIIEELRVTR